MNTNQLVALGSKTAKAGFKNEDDIVNHFNNWENNDFAKAWLAILGHDISKIQSVKSSKAPGRQKADVQVRVKEEGGYAALHNIQVKLVSNPRGFNQVDKRWVDKYVELWNIPDRVTNLLKQFTGEIIVDDRNKHDTRRTLLTEMNQSEQKIIVNFFEDSRTQIICDVLKGRGEFCADWVLVILKSGKEIKWVLKPMAEAVSILGSGEVVITDRGSLRIGRVLMQRKGGDGGRKSAQMLQFKVNPVELFNR